MKFTCLQSNLAKSLANVSRVVTSRPSLPVLANVLVEAEKGRVKFSATDLEIGINTWVGADVEEEGKTTVSAKMFFEFVNSMPSGKIDVELTRGQLIVKTENNEAKFNVLPADEFPQVPGATGDALLNIPKESFVKALNRVVIAAATDESRPIFTGISFEGRDNVLTLVGLDGFRLAKQVIDLSTSLSSDLDLIIPAKALVEVTRSKDDSTEGDSDQKGSDSIEVYLLKDKNQVVFKVGDTEIVSRLIEGKFPNYKQVIPTGYQTRAEMKLEEFQSAVKIANIFARNDLNNKVVVNVDKDKNKITLAASLAEVGQNKTDFNSKVEGNSLEIGFKTKYLMDMMNEMEGEVIYMEGNDSKGAGVFKLKTDSSYLHIIMPMLIDR
jgi:DNA polymerase-3 subunit beta